MSREKIKQVGRPIPDERSTEKLIKYIIQYKEKYPNKTIKFSGLEKEFGIKRHIWRDRKEVKDKIEELNEVDLGIDNIDLLKYEIELLPDIEEIISRCKGDSKKLSKTLEEYDEFVKNLFQKSCEYSRYKFMYEEALVNISELKEKNRSLQIEVENYKKQYYKLCIDSTSSLNREKEGIKENVIKINSKEYKSDFEDMF